MRELSEELAGFARAIVHGEEPSPQIDASYRNYSLAIAIEVYRNNYRGNLHDALAGAYPVIRQLVGEDFFRQLARKYIEQYSSRGGNLYHYGEQMAEFIARFVPAQGLPYLHDVAALEWACHCAYFSEDAVALDLGRLAQVAPEQYPGLIFITHPACHVMRSVYPLTAIWHAHQFDAPPDFHIDLAGGPCNAMVMRRDDVVLVTEILAAEADWLINIRAGVPLGEATGATLARYPDFDLQATLVALAAQGVLVDYMQGTKP